ncbi:MAG: hypothetical protein ACJAQT_003884 [Akkermansiaceae bacterium]|jgi:hypothetical protein
MSKEPDLINHKIPPIIPESFERKSGNHAGKFKASLGFANHILFLGYEQ